MARKKTIDVADISSRTGKKLMSAITQARSARSADVEKTVSAILDDVRRNGDAAVFAYTKTFDGKSLTAKTVRLSLSYINDRAALCKPPLKKSIRNAAERIHTYHSAQFKPNNFSIDTPEGTLSQRVIPLARVGVYIPGGYTAYSSSVLMNVIPARIAGVKQIVAMTPYKGDLDPAVAYVLKLLKIDECYQVGGAQAIAAMAYGTASIRPVDKIVGPGNSYVAAAKRLVYGTVDIDSIAGPSEVAILCDATAHPDWVALDLLSQAEHGSGDEVAVCITDDPDFARRVADAVVAEIVASPVQNIFEKLSTHAISVFVGTDRSECIEFINAMGPEHLEIQTKNPEKDLKSIYNAAAVFLGHYTPVAMGDYYVGTNHVLPTGGAARYASPLGVDSFLKRMSVATVTRAGILSSAPDVSRFARAEKFVHHALSVERRAGIVLE